MLETHTELKMLTLVTLNEQSWPEVQGFDTQ